MSVWQEFCFSGYKFTEDEENLKYRYQIINMGLLFSVLGIAYGMSLNYLRGVHSLFIAEGIVLVAIFSMVYLLRKHRGIIDFVAFLMTAMFLFLFLFFIYNGNPLDLKHIWILAFPIILLYFQSANKILFWLLLMTTGIMIAPLQSFVEVQYTFYQASYLAIALLMEGIMIHSYQTKMDAAQHLILQQKQMLLEFNSRLEEQVKEKTTELTELNEWLEIKVEQKVEELRKKDQILETQSKQAVMGEMISMIAHQWRQPLSTITLQIANLQVDKLLGKDITSEGLDTALDGISHTIVYLSETIDDFLTYFNPSKELVEVELEELIQKSLSFITPRLTDTKVKFEVNNPSNVKITTYTNEFVQVILNLVNNAIDAHQDIKVENPYVKIDVLRKGRFVLISISDNAGGIPQANLEKLFEPYFSTKGKNGTGLGLYMSQMIVEKQFDGSINVASSNKGSVFTIKIPAT